MPSPLTLPLRYTTHKPPLSAPIRGGRALTPRPSALWSFREGAGPQTWESVGRGRTSLGPNCSWAVSPFGVALRATGSGLSTAGIQTTVPQPAPPCTLFARLLLSALPVGNPQAILGGTVHTGGIIWRIETTGNLYLLKDQAAAMFESAGTLSVGVWHDVAVSYDGSVVAMYIDGLPSGNGSSSQSFTAMDWWLFGAANDAEAYDANATMTVAHVGVYRRVLTPGQVASLHAAPFAMY